MCFPLSFVLADSPSLMHLRLYLRPLKHYQTTTSPQLLLFQMRTFLLFLQETSPDSPRQTLRLGLHQLQTPDLPRQVLRSRLRRLTSIELPVRQRHLLRHFVEFILGSGQP